MTVNQFAQNLVWASPAAATGAPAMRALVAADIPGTLGATTFSGQITVDAPFVVSLAANPNVTWEASGNTTNQKNTQLLDTGAGIEFLFNNDAFSASNPALALTRSGYTPTNLTWYGSEFLITNTTNPNITLTAGSTDAYIAKITSAGAYFSDTVANDLAIRSNEGTIRMGVSGGSTSALQMTNTTLNFNGTISQSSKNVLVDQAGWTAWTPTVASTGGSLTTVSVPLARYQQLGRFVYFRLQVNITTNGTGSGGLTFTLPITALDTTWSGSGKEFASTGKMVAISGYNTTTAYVANYDNTYPGGSGYEFVLSGFYEAATG